MQGNSRMRSKRGSISSCSTGRILQYQGSTMSVLTIIALRRLRSIKWKRLSDIKWKQERGGQVLYRDELDILPGGFFQIALYCCDNRLRGQDFNPHAESQQYTDELVIHNDIQFKNG